jgi:very-short-patch-repair endonuclease
MTGSAAQPPGPAQRPGFAPAAGVAVEIDGGYHRFRCAADARRDEALRRAGYRVLRLEAELVSKDLPRAVALVRQAVTANGVS